MRKSVLISGVGIAGPTLAYWLGQSSFDLTLVERAPQLRTSGYVIDFWGLGFDIAERMGLLSDLYREGYRVQELRFVDGRGYRVGGFDAEVFNRLTGGRYLTLPRSDLARLIYRRIENGCETIFGDSISGIEENRDGVRVTFEHAAARTFDFVIGADGLHSVVRGLAFGRQYRFEKYLGYAVAAFECKGYRPRDEDVYVSFSVPGKQVGRFAMREDRTLFLFIFASPQPPAAEPHDTAAQKAILRQAFGKAGWECPQILDALDQAEELYFDRVSQIQMQSWSRGRIALVGDAAFCPSLLAGQGSALAMTSSYVLAGELATAPDEHQSAFGRYESLLRSFITGKQRAAVQFAGSLAPRTQLGLFFRNQISKTLRFSPIADFVIGRSLMDRLRLPHYDLFGVA